MDDGLAIDLVSGGNPHEIMRRLVTLAARTADADRCTLTSIDQHVFRVEASYEVGGPPDFVGHEYPMTWLSRQPLLQEAIHTGAIVIGGGFGQGADVEPALAPALLDVVHTGIVPLTIGDSVGAVLILSRKRESRSWPETSRDCSSSPSWRCSHSATRGSSTRCAAPRSGRWRR